MDYYKLVDDRVVEISYEELFDSTAHGRFCQSLLKTTMDIYGFEISISTIFLALNHGSTKDNMLNFETMIFGNCEELLNYQWRYSTLHEAVIGHTEAISFSYGFLRGYKQRMKDKK